MSLIDQHIGLTAVIASQFDVVNVGDLMVRRKWIDTNYSALAVMLPAINAAIAAQNMPPADPSLTTALCEEIAALNLSHYVVPEAVKCQ